MKPQRIQRRRAKGWRMPEGAVYVGRPTKWSNPFYVNGRTFHRSLGVIQEVAIPDAATAVRLYRNWINLDVRYVLGTPPPPADMIQRELRGKDLACWCPLDQPCHADVLLEIANA